MTSEVEKENKELARQVEVLQQRLEEEIRHRQNIVNEKSVLADRLERTRSALYQLIATNKLMYGTLGQIQMSLVQNSGLVIGNMKIIEPFYSATLDQAIDIINHYQKHATQGQT